MLWLGRYRNRKLIDAKRVREAIVDAERRTSGEIRVSLAPWFWGSVERAADRAFLRLGMTRTRERNGVLFFVIPSRSVFVACGDIGIHARGGQPFWDELATMIAAHFRKGEFTEGLEAGVVRTGGELARHFPLQAGTDKNELADEVDLAQPTEGATDARYQFVLPAVCRGP